MKHRLICNDIRMWEKIDFIEESTSSIYMYHHSYKKPFTKSRVCNHYAYLIYYEEANPKECFEIYRNPYEKSKSSPSDPLLVPSSDDEVTMATVQPQTKRQKTHDEKEAKEDGNKQGTKEDNVGKDPTIQ